MERLVQLFCVRPFAGDESELHQAGELLCPQCKTQLPLGVKRAIQAFEEVDSAGVDQLSIWVRRFRHCPNPECQYISEWELVAPRASSTRS